MLFSLCVGAAFAAAANSASSIGGLDPLLFMSVSDVHQPRGLMYPVVSASKL